MLGHQVFILPYLSEVRELLLQFESFRRLQSFRIRCVPSDLLGVSLSLLGYSIVGIVTCRGENTEHQQCCCEPWWPCCWTKHPKRILREGEDAVRKYVLCQCTHFEIVERWCESLSLFQLSSAILYTDFLYHAFCQWQPRFVGKSGMTSESSVSAEFLRCWNLFRIHYMSRATLDLYESQEWLRNP